MSPRDEIWAAQATGIQASCQCKSRRHADVLSIRQDFCMCIMALQKKLAGPTNVHMWLLVAILSRKHKL